MNYTVGTQKMKTNCKRRSKAFYRKYILFHRKKILTLSHKKNIICEKFLPMTGKFFLWQEISYCDRKLLPVTGNVSSYRIFFLRQEILFFWQRILSSERKFILLKGSFLLLLWQEISSWDRKFLPVNWVKNHAPLS